MTENLLWQYGFNSFFEQQVTEGLPEGLYPGRIVAEHKSQYVCITEKGELPAALSGKFRFSMAGAEEAPIVGDYVRVQVSDENDRVVIQKIMNRKTLFYRKDSFNGTLQLMAANFDTVFICMSLNRDFNLARLSRYLVMARESGAEIAVVLTKSDLSPDGDERVALCASHCGEIPVYPVSSVDGEGLLALLPYFSKGKTVVALGSSGVGKSTLVNALFGQEIMKTSEVRSDDDRGRHTTVHRQLILLPSGGLYMDTPGIREMELAEAEEGFSDVFGDMEQLLSRCRFSDCRHENEPGCALRAAIASGEITEKNYQQYVKLKKEAMYSDNKRNFLQARTEKFKKINKELRNRNKGPRFK